MTQTKVLQASVPKSAKPQSTKSINKFFALVNSEIDPNTNPWTVEEQKQGRQVLIETTDTQLMAKLRHAYYMVGWTVYAIHDRGIFYLEFSY